MRSSAYKAVAAAAFAVMAAIPAASAADMAPRYTKAPPVLVEVWNWTGFYVGGNAGYSWGRSNTDVSYFNTFTGAAIVPPPGSITNAGFDMNGAIAGGQAGYNWQTNNWVWGLEADIQWSDEKGRGSFLCSSTIIGGPCLPGLTFLPPGVTGTSAIYDQKLEWFGTVRGRAGILATPKVLLYATGGFAYGSIKTSATLNGFTPAGLGVTSFGSSTDTRYGWTVGAGIEGKITQNWSAKLEYLYMDLGNFGGGTYTLPAPTTIGFRTDSNFRDHILRAGINYTFGGPLVAKY